MIVWLTLSLRKVRSGYAGQNTVYWFLAMLFVLVQQRRPWRQEHKIRWCKSEGGAGGGRERTPLSRLKIRLPPDIIYNNPIPSTTIQYPLRPSNSLYWTIQFALQPSNTLYDPLRPSNTLYDHPIPSKAIQHPLRPSNTPYDHPISFKTIEDRLLFHHHPIYPLPPSKTLYNLLRD